MTGTTPVDRLFGRPWCETLGGFGAWLDNAGLQVDRLPAWHEAAPVRVVALPGSLFLERIPRAQHGTFEDYCRERWGMTRRHANRLVGAAGVVSNLSTMVDIPTSERQARPLASLPADLQPIVWQEAVDSAPPGMTFEEWEQTGHTLQQIQGAVNWWVGDWLNEGEKRYGETYAQAIEVTGWRVERLQDCKWVSGQVQNSFRNEFLSWTHHREVAALPPDEQADLLQWAEVNDASVADLKKEKRRRRAGAPGVLLTEVCHPWVTNCQLHKMHQPRIVAVDAAKVAAWQAREVAHG